MTGSGFTRRLLALTRKEFHQLLRDRSNLAIGIVLPIVLIFIFGFGLSLDVKNAPLGIVYEDASPMAQEAMAGLTLSPAIAPVPLASMHDAELLMRERRIDGIVRVPPDFSRALAAGDAQVQLIVHGADAGRASIIQAYASAGILQALQRRADRGEAPPPGMAGAGSVRIVERLWFNSANTSTWYLVPGLIVLIMTLVGAFLTALVMAREWERGTLEALFVTPVRPWEILLAKVIPYFAVALLGLALCLVAARWLFHVPMMGSLAWLLLASMLYLVVAVSIGLLISSVTRNQFLASQVALVATFFPSLMLSGFLFDLNNVPLVVRVIGHVLPATYYMELIRTLFLAGDIGAILWRDCAILAAYAVGLLSLARKVTRKSLDR